MIYVAPNKVIHTAISAPGAGKTQALISQLPALLSAGRCIVLALPTKILSTDIVSRLPVGIDHYVINSDTCYPNPVGPELQAALGSRTNKLIITTHASIFSVPPNMLRGWMLVVDELPAVVGFPDFPFTPSGLDTLFVHTSERDGHLHIREGCDAAIETSLKIFRAAKSGAKQTSMLSEEGAKIFTCLLNGNPVFIGAKMDNGKRHVHAVEEYNHWKIFAAANEVHVLAANIDGSLFDEFAQVHGFTYTRSIFTPVFEGYNSLITIYPAMPKGRDYSKTKAEKIVGDIAINQYETIPFTVVDAILKAALQKTNGTPLLFSNEWAGFKWLNKKTVHVCSIDSRGLNDYQGETDAILLFGGNPSPADKRSLQYLATKYARDFRHAFAVTRLLEPSLQAATRTAVRVRGNTQPITIFVQDERVADYLVKTYMPNAVIDWSFSQITPVQPDGRKVEDPRKAQVFELFDQDMRNADIVRLTGVSRGSATNWKREWKTLKAA